MNITEKDIPFATLLIKRYPLYDLSELDAMVLLVSDKVLEIEDTLLTCDILSSYMKASREDIDLSLSKLLSKNFVEVVDVPQKGLRSTLDSFKKRLFADWVRDITLEKKVAHSKDGAENLYAELERIGGRTLSPIERDMVTKWLQSGATKDMVLEATKRTLTKSGDLSFKRADKMILELERSEGRKKIGVSTVDEDLKKKQEIQDIIRNTHWTIDD